MITCSSILCTVDDLMPKLVDKTVPFHNPVLRQKLKTFASDGVIKVLTSRQCTCPFICQVKYVTSFNTRSDLRNFVNH